MNDRNRDRDNPQDKELRGPARDKDKGYVPPNRPEDSIPDAPVEDTPENPEEDDD